MLHQIHRNCKDLEIPTENEYIINPYFFLPIVASKVSIVPESRESQDM